MKIGNPLKKFGLTGKILPLVYYGDRFLQQPAQAVESRDRQLFQLAADMIATMHHANGIGLAAPQVRKGIRLIVIDLGALDLSTDPPQSPAESIFFQQMPQALLNPRIIAASANLESCEEGCLSLPNLHAPVTRPASISIQAEYLDGSLLQLECGGLLARCLQHEIDHLDGVTFNQRLSEADAINLGDQLELLRRRTRKQLKRGQ